jgi:hypothetical protein
MLRMLIDDHPGGWATIVGGGAIDTLTDFNLKPGLVYDAGERGSEQRKLWDRTPQCCCHGDGRSTKDWRVTQDNATRCGCEWAYVINRKGHMAVLASYRKDGARMIGRFGSGDPEGRWLAVHLVDLTSDKEPDWEKIEKSAQEHGIKWA